MALNIPAMQVPFQPVTSYREGRAFRTAMAAEEQQSRLRDQEIQMNELKLEAARNPQVDPKEVRAQREFEMKELGTAMDMGVEYQARALSAYQSTLEGTGDEAQAMNAAQTIFDQGKTAFSNMFPDMASEGVFDDDGVFDPKEAASLIQTAESVRSQIPGERAEFLSPEEIRAVGLPEGSVYARQPDGRIQAMYTPPSGTDDKVRTQKINDLVSQGVPRDRAVLLVDNFERMEMTDAGTVRFLNEVDGTATEIPVSALQGGDTIEVSDKDGYTLWDLAPFATGAAPGVVQLYNIVGGMIGLPINERVAQARQTIQAEYGALRRALSANPRYPVAEMERLEKEVSLQPSFTIGSDLFRANMRGAHDVLSRRYRYELNDANDTRLSESARSDARRAATDIKNFLDVMGVPEQASGGSLPVVRSDDDAAFDAMEAGKQFVDENGVVWKKDAEGYPVRVR